jgi:hypothetical protein
VTCDAAWTHEKNYHLVFNRAFEVLRQPTEGFFWILSSVDGGCFPILSSPVSNSTAAGVTVHVL